MQGTLDRHNLRDIKPPLEVAHSLLPFFIGGAVVLAFIAVSVWLYLRKRGRAATVSLIEADDAPGPHEVAYERLAAIEASAWLKRGEMETYHTHIAHVLREYIRGRYQIPALALTTTALLNAMRQAQIGVPHVERVQQLLANCDKVKFASYQPVPSEAVDCITAARWIVDETKTSIS